MAGEMAVLFPGKEIPVSGGRNVRLRPWGMDLGIQLTPRVAKLATDLVTAQSFDMTTLSSAITPESVAKLVVQYQLEIKEIIRESLEMSQDDWDAFKFQYEDLFTLAQAVMNVCLIGEDGNGPLVQMLGLLARPAPATQNPTSPSVSTP